jgi:ankyrin repeat protein
MFRKTTIVVLIGLIITQVFVSRESKASGLASSEIIFATQKRRTVKPQSQKPQRRPESDDLFTLMNSIAVGDTQTVKEPLDKGVDVNSKARGGLTPLMLAVSVGNRMRIVEMLLAKGADVNAKDKSGMTPLLSAIGFEEGKLLLEKGAEVNAKNAEGKTALLFAVEGYKSEEYINFLLDQGADVNVKDKKSNTALTFAIKTERPEIVALLKKAGAKD